MLIEWAFFSVLTLEYCTDLVLSEFILDQRKIHFSRCSETVVNRL